MSKMPRRIIAEEDQVPEKSITLLSLMFPQEGSETGLGFFMLPSYEPCYEDDQHKSIPDKPF